MKSDVTRQVHRRNTFIRYEGQASEHFELDVVRNEALIRLEHDLPLSIPIEDLMLSLQLRSNLPGAAVALRLRFPKQTDPRNGSSLTAWVISEDRYSTPGAWQQLTCRVSKTAVRDTVRRLRAELQPVPLNLDGAVIDRAAVLARVPAGTVEFFIDELRYSGFAPPREQSQEITPTGGTRSEEPAPSVVMQLDRLLVEGHPTVLRMAPHHGEDLDRLREMGFNLLWIDSFDDPNRIREIRDRGMWVMASPPRGRVESGNLSGTVALVQEEFGPETDGILAWYCGTRVPPEGRELLTSQVQLLRTADKVRRRPIFADIGGLERSYSRLLDGAGLSRHPLHTSFPIHDYREFLTRKSRQLRPGTFVTTWIQTEADAEALQRQLPRPVVEPEQIRLLAWTALSAGVRGIGFWKRTAFTDDFAGARERELMIAIINQEIALLEPWLANRSIIDYERVPDKKTQTQRQLSGQQDPSSSNSYGLGKIRAERTAALKKKALLTAPQDEPELIDVDNQIEMAVIHSPNGLLLVPLWHQTDAQFVPGQMAARSIQLIVPGVPDTATVWQVSTTEVRSLPREPVSGGLRITIDNFDQMATLVVSSDQSWGSILRERIQQISTRSAGLWLELARAKLQRVRVIDNELQVLLNDLQLPEGSPADGPQLLDSATNYLQLAEATWQKMQGNRIRQTSTVTPPTVSDPHLVRQLSEAALQSLRILQRSHWDVAVGRHESPLYSPYTVCFSTLPDHWRLIRRLGAGTFDVSPNLLPAGGFDDSSTETMTAIGWEPRQQDIEGIRSAVELIPDAGGRGLVLRLVAAPSVTSEPLPEVLDGTPVAMQTPPITIKAGQLVHISGRIQITARPEATLEGVSLVENLSGSRWRWQETSGWESFSMIREVTEETPLVLRLTLHGIGDVQFDDLKVVTSDLAPPAGR